MGVTVMATRRGQPEMQLPVETPLPTIPTETRFSFLFTGDLMFDRYIREVAAASGYDYILSDLKQLFLSSDLVVGNLEGPVTDNPSVSLGSAIGTPPNYVFTFPVEIPGLLFRHNIRLVSLGNNHIGNQGIEGIVETAKRLRAQDIRYFGDTGREGVSIPRSAIVSAGPYRIGLVNYNQFSIFRTETPAEIEKLESETDYTVVIAHWGEEYLPVAPDSIRQLGRSFVDSGADLVIGTHPHVVQDRERYRQRRLYYSLGNTVMDQYFSAETQEGLLVGLTLVFTDTGFEEQFREYTVTMSPDGRTTHSGEKPGSG